MSLNLNSNVVCAQGELDRVGTAGQRLDVPVFTGQTANRSRAQWEADAAHIARHDPARVLREVKAKRAIVALHVPEYVETINPDRDEISGEICTLCDEPFPCDSLKLMAAPDAEHADFNPAWAIAT